VEQRIWLVTHEIPKVLLGGMPVLVAALMQGFFEKPSWNINENAKTHVLSL